MESCLDLHLIDTYGSTETGPVLIDGYLVRPPVTDYKLVDVAELGYYRTDRPHPRGELLIKSDTLTCLSCPRVSSSPSRWWNRSLPPAS